MQKEIGPNDEVRIVPVKSGTVPEPIKKFEMGRAKSKAWEGNVCEFYQRNETEVEHLTLYMTKKLSSTQRQIITNWVWKAWSQY